MKLLSAAICLVSLGVLTGCVDDPGYRTGGYYTTGVYYRSYYRSYDRDRYYRDYDRRYWGERREWRDRRDRDRGQDRSVSEWRNRPQPPQPRTEPSSGGRRDVRNAPVILPNGRAIYPD